MSQMTHSPPALSNSPAPLSPASSNGPAPVPSVAIPLNPMAHQAQLATDPSSGPVRRKTSRRANTAERRATHNAVERQRRETLNGRFLDLAALLPNLAAVRRPSKSAIVNSSIALIHTQRRYRGQAGRELRTLKAETDALRRELNEWRDRAGLAHVVEPGRTPDFVALLNLEEPSAAEEEEIRRAYEMASIPIGDDDEDEYGPPYEPPHIGHHQAVVVPHHAHHMQVPQSAPAHIAHHAVPPPPQQQQQQQQQVYAPPPMSVPAQHHQHPMQPPHHAPSHHDIQAQIHAAAMMQTQGQRPSVHIPAFDGPSMFPGPGHHNAHSAPQSAIGMPQGGMYPQYTQSTPSPPQTAHYAQSAYPQRPGTGSPHAHQLPFAHVAPPAREDDAGSVSSSSAGSPPATAHSAAGFGPSQEVPALAAGATPADFARFWGTAPPAPKGMQQGYAMGFAM